MSLNKIFNLKYLGKSNMSLAKAVLFFYLIIGSNFTKNLYSGQLKDFLSENRLAQHVIGFTMMLALIISFGGVVNITHALFYSTLAYIWFIFTTKLDIQWNLVIFILLIIGFLYESQLLDKEIQSINDESLDENDIKRIRKRNYEIKNLIVISIIGITIVGTLFYFNKKQVQYGGNFDIVKYIFAPRNK